MSFIKQSESPLGTDAGQNRITMCVNGSLIRLSFYLWTYNCLNMVSATGKEGIMITFTLDESGRFEDTEDLHMIAGFIYDDRELTKEPGTGRRDTWNEEERIRSYLASCCKNVGGIYPEDLHGKTTDIKIKVKNEIRFTLPQFISKGTYHGEAIKKLDSGEEIPERKGVYTPFIIMESPRKVTRRADADSTNFNDDSKNSNLYIHMVETLINHVSKEMIGDTSDNISFSLPTRKIVLESKSDEYRNLYGRPVENKIEGDNKAYYQQIERGTYRTMIEQALNDAGYKGNISISIQSTNYHNDDPKNPAMTFLYLADAVNGYFGGTIEKEDVVPKTIKQSANLKNCVWFFYDDAEYILREAEELQDKGNIFEAMRLIAWEDYKRGPETNFGVTLPVWKEYKDGGRFDIFDDLNRDDIKKTIVDFNQYMFSDRKKPKEAFETYRLLEDLVNKKCEMPADKDIFLDLYDIAVSVHCHMGMPKKAEEYHLKFLSCRPSADRRLAEGNKYSTLLTGMFRFDDAKRVAEENLVKHEKMLEEESSAAGTELFITTDHARTYSQLGQCISFKQGKGADEYFLKALSAFPKPSTDYYMTMSFLLHYYIEAGDESSYGKYAAEYFDTSDRQEQFNRILEEGNKKKPSFTAEFALFFWIKASYTFYRDDKASRGAINLLRTQVNPDYSTGQYPWLADKKNHPWECIYKYMALFIIDAGSTEAGLKIAHLLIRRIGVERLRTGDTPAVIIKFGHIQYKMKKGDTDAALDECRELLGMISGLKGEDILEEENLYEQVQRLVTYTFR